MPITVGTIGSSSTLSPSNGASGLDLDFAAGRFFLNSTARLNPADVPGWSFSRTGAGTALQAGGSVIQFATGVPRITNRGILVEEARTNLALQSQNVATTWATGESTATAAVASAPDGTTTAGSIVETVNNAQHNIQQTITIASGSVYTISVLCKPLGTGSKRWLRLFWNSGWAALPNVVFDVALGTIGAVNNATATITALANGWYRCTVTPSTNSNATSAVLRVGLDSTGTNVAYAGDGVSGLLVWGMQAELGSFATTPIITTGAAATRGAENPNVTGLVFPDTFVAFAELSLDAVRSNETMFELSDGTTSNRIRVSRGVTTGNFDFFSQASGGAQPSQALSGSGNPAGGITRVAIRVRPTGARLAARGFIGTEVTITRPALSAMFIGRPTDQAALMNAYGARFRIIPGDMSDAALQALTS